MNVSLTPELDQFVRAKMESGHYHTASEVVREALRLLYEQELSKEARLAEFRRRIDESIESLDRGEGIPAKEAFAKLRKRARSKK